MLFVTLVVKIYDILDIPGPFLQDFDLFFVQMPVLQ